jgi:choline dehydrogenase
VISDLSVVDQNLRDTPNLGGVIHGMNVPLLYIGWLDSAIDQEIAVAAVKRAHSIASHISAFGKELSPGSNVTTDAQILDHIKKKGVTAIHHGAATCAMGRNTSSGAVVDSQARVFWCDWIESD